MIKGVNKQIVEINDTQNEYIEKAILILNPQKSRLPRQELEEKALKYINTLFPAKRCKKDMVMKICVLGLGFLSAAALAIYMIL